MPEKNEKQLESVESVRQISITKSSLDYVYLLVKNDKIIGNR